MTPLHRGALLPNPLQQFGRWFEMAREAGAPKPHAMCLATADEHGQPSARVVLLRSYDPQGFVFCMNYASQKGQELAANPAAALVNYWHATRRQVRILGRVAKIARTESEAYSRQRPRGSQIGARASDHGKVIENRAYPDQRAQEVT